MAITINVCHGARSRALRFNGEVEVKKSVEDMMWKKDGICECSSSTIGRLKLYKNVIRVM